MDKRRENQIYESLITFFNKIEEEKKSVYKGGKKENVKTSQRGIYLTNADSKVYRKTKEMQYTKKKENIPDIQRALRKNGKSMYKTIVSDQNDNVRRYRKMP